MLFKYFIVTFMYFTTVLSEAMSENSTCIGVECNQTISMPLIDSMKAILKADIDVTEINKVLKAYIKKEIKVGFENSVKKIIKDVLVSNITKGNQSLEARPKASCSSNTSCGNNAICQANPLNDSSFTCLCRDGYVGHSCQIADSKRNDYFLLFTDGYRSQYATAKALISKQGNGRVSAYYFSNGLNQSLNIMNNNEYSLNREAYMTDGLTNAGIELHSNVKCMVYGMIYNNYSSGGFSGYSEGYLAIPSIFLGRNYIVPSFKVYNENSDSMIAITPSESSTTVNLNFQMTSGIVTYKHKKFLGNDNLTIVLNKYETFQISHTSDLTGTLISSTSPVAVVSGNKCNYISGGGGCNPFIEMVLPVEQLDTAYIVPHIATRFNSTVRVISLRDGSITIQSNNQVTTKHCREREFVDFYHDSIAIINATSNVCVMIYPHEMENKNGDAFMMTIHGINQYLPEYNFVVPSGFTSYLSVTVETSGLNGFILDGHLVSTDTVYTVYGGIGSYSSFIKEIQSGEHNLKHSKDVKFGLWVYGNERLDAYGYPAGIAFRKV